MPEPVAVADGDTPTTPEMFPDDDCAPLRQGKVVIADESMEEGAGPGASDSPSSDDTAMPLRPQAPRSGHQAALLSTAVDDTVGVAPEPAPASLTAIQMGTAPDGLEMITSDDKAPAAQQMTLPTPPIVLENMPEIAAATDGDAPTTPEIFPNNDGAPLRQGKIIMADETMEEGASPGASDSPSSHDTAIPLSPQAPRSGHQATLLSTAVDNTVGGAPEPAPASLTAIQMGAAPAGLEMITSNDKAPVAQQMALPTPPTVLENMPEPVAANDGDTPTTPEIFPYNDGAPLRQGKVVMDDEAMEDGAKLGASDTPSSNDMAMPLSPQAPCSGHQAALLSLAVDDTVGSAPEPAPASLTVIQMGTVPVGLEMISSDGKAPAAQQMAPPRSPTVLENMPELAAATDGDAPTTPEISTDDDGAPLRQGKVGMADEATEKGAGPGASDSPSSDDTAMCLRPQASPSGHQAALLSKAVDGTVGSAPEPAPAPLAASQMGTAPAGLEMITNNDNTPSHPGQVAAHNEAADPEGAVPEERVELIAPQGRMGIVLVDPCDPGPCYIFNIREDSPLLEKARQGDRVVEIDGEDVSGMSSVNVSKLLGSRASDERIIIVKRYVDAGAPPHRMASPPSANEPNLPAPLPEATPVDGEATRSLSAAVQTRDTKPLPWWKRRRKVLLGGSLSVVAAGMIGALLSRNGPSISNFTYYADQQNELCSHDPLGRLDGTDQRLFETVENCCEESFLLLRHEECIMKSYGMAPSSGPSASHAPSYAPSTSLRPSLRPTSSSAPSMSLAMRLQSSALQLVTSEDVVGGWRGWTTEIVAIQGDTAVIGSPFDDNWRGAAFVMERSESGWSQLAKLGAPDREGGYLFGGSVAIDGDTIVVGALMPDSQKGLGHVFTKINDSWRHQAHLVAADDDDISYGYSVDIYQDRVVGGAVNEDSIGDEAGAAYVFVQNETTWTLESKLLTPAGDVGDLFGRSVGIFADTIVVGAPFEDTRVWRSGAAHIFSRILGGSWEYRAKLSSPGGAPGDEFGWSVGIHGNRVIVGSPFDNSNGYDAGASFVFVDDGSEWTLEAKLLAPGRAMDDRFGESVSMFEGTAIVGSPLDDDNGYHFGCVHLFHHAQGAWSHRAKVLAPDGAVGNEFGHSVAVHNGTVIAHSFGSGDTFSFSE